MPGTKLMAMGVCAALLASALTIVAADPTAASPRLPRATPVAPVPGHVRPSTPALPDRTAALNMTGARPVSWPAASTTTLTLAAVPVAGLVAGTGASTGNAGNTGNTRNAGTAASGNLARAWAVVPNTPIAVSRVAGPALVGGRPGVTAAAAAGPDQVRVEVLDRASAAGSGHPLVVRLTAVTGSGPVAVRVDFRGFAEAFGGNWSSRLSLVRLPQCALSTPWSAGCAPVGLATVNDRAAGTVSATVDVPGSAANGPTAAVVPAGSAVLVALASAPASGSGDYTATGLQASATWSGGAASGDFTWSYPMRVPPSLGGSAPRLGLDYSSQAVDGKTAAANSQPSWIGEGFDLSMGAIVRSARPCTDDGQSGVGDLCWGGDNATLSMPNRGGELIQVSTSPDIWRLSNDDGSRIERLTDTVNGDQLNEYWKLTATNGVQYFFGLNRLPGWSATKPETGSAFTVPVFGNDAGEPCHGATFATSSCPRAYQWNLDYVVDPHGNTMSVWYAPETNHYARAHTDTLVSSYTRGGTIARIDYGTRQDSGVDSEFVAGANVPQRVLFGVEDRCVTSGATCVPSNPSNWPDVPWDQSCTSTTACPGIYSPTFFTQKMLGTVTTQVWTGPGSTYQDVDVWTLRHVFKDPGNNTAKILWLDALGYAGKVGATTTVPDVTFGAVQMNNRVDLSGANDPIIRFRLNSIADESGGQTSVTYSAAECVKTTNMPATPDTNTKRCFPALWTGTGTSLTLEYFHKYVVTDVVERDLSGGNPAVETHYQYLDTPMWHYDDAEFVPPTRRSWGQWRGYAKVRQIDGAAGSPQQQSDTIYFRGMNGDKLSTGTRVVTLAADPDFGPAAINDEPWRSGQVRESISYNGTGDSAPVTGKTLYEPWQHGPTATRTRNGVTVNAYATGVATVTAKTALDGGRGWRTTQKSTTFDFDAGVANPVGRPVRVDNLGDLSTPADDQCSRFSYAVNVSAWIVDHVSEIETVGVNCATTANRATDLLGDARTWYDGATGFSSTLVRGDSTKVEVMSSWNNGNPTYQQATRTTYDSYGRVLDAYDALDHKTSSVYTPASGAPVTATTVTNPVGWTATATVEPAWGAPTSKVDVNGNRTDISYDGLGRMVGVWKPGRAKATQPASVQFSYLIRNTGGPSAVATRTLNTDGSGYRESWQLYDGLLRARQTQQAAPGGGRIMTDIRYDSLGQPVTANEPYYDLSAPGSTLFVPTGAVPGRAVTTYDNAGRAVVSAFQVNGVEQWRTTTAYGGDHVDVTPPAGGTPTATWSDARGLTTQLRQYRGATVTGTYDLTSYTYTRSGQIATVTGPDGVAAYTASYDLMARRTRDTTKDRGAVDYTYDGAGRLSTTQDARGNKLAYLYDNLNRKVGLFLNSTAGTQLAGWTYDTLPDNTVVKGQLTTSTRYVGSDRYESAITGFDANYRPTGTSVKVPAAQGALAGTWTSTITYNVDGSVATQTMPYNASVTGGLPAETLTYGYNALGMPTTLNGLSSYITNTGYDNLSRLTGQDLSTGGRTLNQIWDYEQGTSRMREHATLEDAAGRVSQDLVYAYDAIGKITSIKDQTAQWGAGPDDNQCFRYDYLQRMVEAWTPGNGDCVANPSVAGLGGPAPYWQSWTMDVSGNRQTQTEHAAAGNTTRTSTYPAMTADRPHAVSTVAIAGPSGSTTDTFTYDLAGALRTRALAGNPVQTLAWNAEGQLASVTDSTTSTSYLYGANGERLLRTDAGGTTLYLAGEELHASGSTVTATRFYGGGVVRTTSGGVSFTVADHQSTNTLSVRATDLAVTQRRIKPYGEIRGGTPPSWPTDKGFVGGTNDATGLVHLGAREFDPTNGRFITADPVTNSADPQALNSYAYADNDPVSASDPNGMFVIPKMCPDGDCSKPKPAPAAPTRKTPRLLAIVIGHHAVKIDAFHSQTQIDVVFFWEDNGTVVRQGCSGPESPGPVPMTLTCGDAVAIGAYENCGSPNLKDVCFQGPDGWTYDIWGHRSCDAFKNAPCSRQQAAPNRRNSSSPNGAAANPLQFVAAKPPTAFLSNPGEAPFIPDSSAADFSCYGALACKFGDALAWASAVAGFFGPFCAWCDAAGFVLGVASAAAYGSSGFHDLALRQLGATLVGTVAGGIASAPVSRLALGAPGAEAVGGAAVGYVATSPICGASWWGCDSDMPGFSGYLPPAGAGMIAPDVGIFFRS